MSKNLDKQSKYLSYLLRHKPEDANLTLDQEGWCDIDQLLINTGLTLESVTEIVKTDSKGRYTIDKNRIRANQGHSTEVVNVTFEKVTPPDALYHGTSQHSFELIINSGAIKPMSRHLVHLSAEEDTARAVAARRTCKVGKPVILRIDAKRMDADGITFYKSDNGVYLVDEVPTKYLT